MNVSEQIAKMNKIIELLNEVDALQQGLDILGKAAYWDDYEAHTMLMNFADLVEEFKDAYEEANG